MTQTVVVDNLAKSFGKYRVIDNLSFSIESGCVYGLVGLNGAGKTTLLRLLLGILKPDSGTVTISGSTPWKHHPDFYRRCGVVLESDGFWGNLTAAQNCEIYAAARNVSTKDLKSYLDTFWNDSELFANNKKVRYFSRGQRMQCALCRAFMGQATSYFLDEPVIALDIKAYEHFKLLVKCARDRGATLIISSHQLDTIDDVCDRAGILRDGRIFEINRKGCSCWYIDTTDNPAAATILRNSGASSIQFEKGWHFTHPDAATGIPRIISQLVAAEFPIREVRPEEPGFGEAIRSLYAGMPLKEQL